MPEHQQTQKPGKPDSTFQKQAALTSQNSVSHPASIIQRARINPKSLTAADVLQLQRTIGNRAVGRLLSEIRNPSTVQQVPIQRQTVPEEEKEPLQGKFGKESDQETCPSCVQKQERTEEEEPLQGKFETIQRLEPEEEEKIQMKSVVQRKDISEDEEPLQGKMADPVQRQEILEEDEPIQGKMIGTVQRQETPDEEEPLQKKSENNTGMPDNLKAGVENLSGIDMSDVKVHYNSSKPAEVGALAYTQGTNIHVAPGQEKHLPHEAWHVVQQKQGRVQATKHMKGLGINDDSRLEQEADLTGKNVSNHVYSGKNQRVHDTVMSSQIQSSSLQMARGSYHFHGRSLFWGRFRRLNSLLNRRIRHGYHLKLRKLSFFEKELKDTSSATRLRRWHERGIARKKRGRFQTGRFRTPTGPVSISGMFGQRLVQGRKDDYNGETFGSIPKYSEVGKSIPEKKLLLEKQAPPDGMTDKQKLATSIGIGLVNVAEEDRAAGFSKVGRALVRLSMDDESVSYFDKSVNPAAEIGGPKKIRQIMEGSLPPTGTMKQAIDGYASDSSDEDDDYYPLRKGLMEMEELKKS